MFKTNFILVSVFLVGCLSIEAKAAGSAGLPQATEKLKTKNNQFSESLVPFRKMTDALESKRLTLQRQLDEATARQTLVDAKFGDGQKADVTLKNQITDLQNQLKSTQKTEGDISKTAAELNRTRMETIAAATAENAVAKMQNDAILTALNTDAILMDFATLQKKVGDTDLALEKISGAFDNKVLGAYVKDKMGLLLNSQVMCEAAARCRVSGRKEISADRIQQVLFPGTADSSRKGNLYDKTHNDSSGAQ
ncbi:hypothetical protein [Bdellovibrio sp. HCB337]|uniref:hypothetical protein n=1 Tax=Bdellovibrio sp. HCB337 TaxID=3394358 RepID=UPI0039A72DC2